MDNSDAGLPTGKLSEAEWLISLNAGELIGHLAVTGRLRTREGDRAGERKLRLFGVACCRSLQHWSNLPLVPSTIDAAEQFADGDMEYEQIQGLQEAIEKVGYQQSDQRLSDTDFYSRSLQISRAASLISRFDDGWVYYNHLWEVLREIGVECPETAEEVQNARTIVNLFRDIFGNPFHPALLPPEWTTGTVLGLARQMYESRDFSAMPILADALQDAGCDNSDILNHCRDANAVHVRGCWVVDLVLGKS